MARTVEFRLLGPPRISAQGRPWTFAAPPKTLPLVTYLLLNREASLRRETVACALWPDHSEDDARANLRRHLHRASLALPPSPGSQPWIVSSGATIAWNAAAEAWLDIDAFERAVTLDRLEQAAHLYGGDLLEGYDEPWLTPERERLHAAYLKLLWKLARDARAATEFEKAIAYAERLLAADQWREDALRLILTARYELGDRAGALAEYASFERRLHDELGVEPAGETQALQRLISQDSRLRVQPVAPGHKSARVVLPFVGRSGVIERLMDAWKSAREGDGTTALIGGDAGVGKSRLLSEIATRVEAEGGRVLIGGTGPVETQPYQAVIDALRQALPSLLSHDVAPLWMGVLSIVLPDLAARCPGLRRPPRLDAAGERRRLFQAIGEALGTLARSRPLLLALEDVHWAGRDTIELFESIARLAPGLPLLVVATYRDLFVPGDIQRTLRRLQGDDVAIGVPLGPLSRADVRVIVARVRGDTTDVERRTERLFDVSGGNALFLSEALRADAEDP
ncbi:MAG: AAA family ATPase, partial [Candidatus Velthaea sp.]